MQVLKELTDYLFLLMVETMTTPQKIVTEYIFFQEQQSKITTSKLMEEIFMINQLMTRLNNTKNSERYQQDKDMITPQAAYCIMLILKTILG